MLRLRATAAGVVVALLGGCSTAVNQNATALVVVVEGDPSVRMRAESVRVVVRRPGGADLDTQTIVRGPGDWPFSFVIQARDPSATVEVLVEALDRDDPTGPISVARALTTYALRQTIAVPLMLWSGCLPMRCGSMETCRAASPSDASMGDARYCTSAVIAPGSRVPYSAVVDMACMAGQYRFGAECRALPAPLDGGADVPATPDGPAAPDAPDVPAPVDAPTDSPADVPATDGGSDAGGIDRPDVPLVDAGSDAGNLDRPDVPVDAPADVPGVRDVADVVDVPLACPNPELMCTGSLSTVRTDPLNCGACRVVCPTRPNTIATCAMCACGVTCAAGYANCNNVPGDGCEVDTRLSELNCGGCGMVCPTPANGAAACQGGSCFARCNPGRGDCNGLIGDGCETAGSAADNQFSSRSCGVCGRACPANFNCFSGNCESTLPTSCLEILQRFPQAPSGAYWLSGRAVAGDGTVTRSEPYQAYCEMVAQSGGWTLVLKADGALGANSRWLYQSALWTDRSVLNPSSPDVTRVEAKFDGFAWLPFAHLRILMSTVGEDTATVRTLVLNNWGGNRTLLENMLGTDALGNQRSPGDTIAMRVNRWATLFPTDTAHILLRAEMQQGCINEGFNQIISPAGTPLQAVRIGIIGDDQGPMANGLCNGADSRIGVGGQFNTCLSIGTSGTPNNPVGNVMSCRGGSSGDNPMRDTRSFAWVYVR